MSITAVALLFSATLASDATPLRSGPDRLDTGMVAAFGAAADRAGTAWVAAARPEGRLRLLRSTDFGRTWVERVSLFVDSGVAQLEVVPGFGDSGFIHVFVLGRENSGDLWVWRVSADSARAELLPLAVGPDTIDDFSATVDKDSAYYLYCLYVNEHRTGMNGRFVRSTDFGRTWSMATDWWNCSDPHLSHSAGATVHCVWRYALTGTEIHYQSNRHYGAAGFWTPSRVLSSGDDLCWDPVVVQAESAREWESTVWACFTTARRDSSFTDILSARSWNGGWDWTGGRSFSDPYRDERCPAIGMGLAGARGFLSVVYCQGGDRYGDSVTLYRRCSHVMNPTAWSAPVPVSRVSVSTRTSAAAPRLVHCPFAPGVEPLVFYCGDSPAGPRGLYCSAPWLETSRAPGPAGAVASVVGRDRVELPGIPVLSRPHVLTLHDATGRCRLRRVVRGPSATVDCRGLPGGAYVARLNGADVRWQGRVLVVR